VVALSAREPLDEGDTIEVSITISEVGTYQSARYGVSITIRPGETVAAAQKRAEDFVFEHAQRILEELSV
jgi:hypothetical protein